MEKNKKIAVVFAAVLLVAAMSACSTHSSKSYTFKVETGDKIKIEMDTSGDYSFAQEEGRFRVEKGEDEILQGMFMTKEGYDQYQTLNPRPYQRTFSHALSNRNLRPILGNVSGS